MCRKKRKGYECNYCYQKSASVIVIIVIISQLDFIVNIVNVFIVIISQQNFVVNIG